MHCCQGQRLKVSTRTIIVNKREEKCGRFWNLYVGAVALKEDFKASPLV